MKGTQSLSLFTDLSSQEAQTVQGGCWTRRTHRPSYYYYRPPVTSFYPSYDYGYTGRGGNSSQGSSSAVNQTVNVNVLYED